MCCTRWDGTPSACRPSATPCARHSPAPSPRREHRQLPSPDASGSASPTTGTASWRPPTRIIVRWTQWIFLKLYERGLAYQAEVPVNWCPAQNTVLANEEVKDGKYVETGDPVVRRLMRQWMLRITATPTACWTTWTTLDWPESVKAMQRNWIGRSEGAEIRLAVRRRHRRADRVHHAAGHAVRRHLLRRSRPSTRWCRAS